MSDLNKGDFPYLTEEDWFWVEITDVNKGLAELRPGQEPEPQENILARLDRFIKFKSDLKRRALPFDACTHIIASQIYILMKQGCQLEFEMEDQM